jgi:hypothetical protein
MDQNKGNDGNNRSSGMGSQGGGYRLYADNKAKIPMSYYFPEGGKVQGHIMSKGGMKLNNMQYEGNDYEVY